ncbi:hydrogenase maturation factor [Gluconacetobacter johannae DSM 13595]|uniref:Carbamoyltransferase HypF n=1 Tax=Gluconacetobacter johannae TaxID=112140 RepID=A0A7W4J8V0_9PROT|nr:carbamoyltransferase HypF [Gluconacetobacter johannae]MBB2176693.1 carbamoyltransferase HypF [Gluconacetobacter johannae]GBQ91358.1 hydrogenase maturation factor [Gluconacetobacter johannae DSM 13595]
MPDDPSEPAAERIVVGGLVQAVGFRPFVWRTARRLGLRGTVRNLGDTVEIRVAGPRAARDALVAALWSGPPRARVGTVTRHPGAYDGGPGFDIAPSAAGSVSAGIVADLATCPACLDEIHTPTARRHGYAFTNCVDCGPRFSIVSGFPYDRARTTMAGFALCPACRTEYDDPADRRFHAQPIACPDCGPRLRFVGPEAGPAEGDAALAAAASLLLTGGIVAVKGIGGYHLACLATCDTTVALLRARKGRPAKPLAVMMRDAAMLAAFCRPTAAERQLLADPSAPVVPVATRADAPLSAGLSAGLAPGLDRLGVMLAYTPLHALLLARVGAPLVMSSGNASGCPQVIDDAAALRDLAGIADGWLMHDRPIARRLDDSVMAVVDGQPRTLRRGRGLAPEPLALPPGFAPAPPVLAMGADLKSAFCLTHTGQALLSHHMGNLDDAGVEDALRAALADYRALFAQAPAVVAVDAHPEYRSHALGRRLAAEGGLRVEPVWHHHAHVAACMAEHGLPADGPAVVGLALDGSGLGQDGTIWGGEVLVCDYRAARRVGRLAPVALPGGDVAAREPWRMLLAHLDAALGPDGADAAVARGLAPALAGRPLPVLRAMIRAGVNAPPCSSAGRLFDAMAALLEVAPARMSYEGEAAMRLEALARGADRAADAAPFGLRTNSGLAEIDPAPMWRAALRDKADGVPPARIAAAFHAGLARAFADLAQRAARAEGLDTVALSGGAMHNALLAEALAGRLRAAGLRVLLPARAPAGDGGLALGQAVIAAARSLEGH